MTSRTTTSIVSFAYPFVMAGYSDELPAGDYKIFVEEDLVESFSFTAYRRTATHLRIEGQTGAGRTEMRPIDPENLKLALWRDHKRSTKIKKGEAALSPLEDRSSPFPNG